MNNIKEQWNIYIKSRQSEEAQLTLFEAIWERYYKNLCLFVKPYLADRDTVDDTVQDIMIKVFDRIADYNPLFSFNTWIYRIARNYVTDLARKKTETLCHPEKLEDRTTSYTDSPTDNPLDALLVKEQEALLTSYINRLTDVDRSIVVLRFYENLDYREISAIIGIPSGTVRYRVHQIKKDIKNFWEKHYG